MISPIERIKKRERRLLSHERAAELLAYDAISGALCWRMSQGRGRPGSVAGCTLAKYIVVRIDSSYFVAHRIAWLLHYGEWPDGIIDHIDRDGKNNAIKNLRVATAVENQGNSRRRIDNTSGFKGVCWDRRKKSWLAQIGVGGRSKHIGYYSSAEHAHLAYVSASKKVFGEFSFSGCVK